MNILKKIALGIIVAVFIVLFQSGFSFGALDLETMINDFDGGTFHLGNNYDVSLFDDRIYCISRGSGMGTEDANKWSGDYMVKNAIRIDRNGITYTDKENYYSQVNTLTWDQIEDRGFTKVAKQIYYILSANDSYGRGYSMQKALPTNQIEVECINEKGIKGTSYTNERQYALWMKINSLLENLGIDEGRNNNTYSDGSQNHTLLSNCESTNSINIQEPVYMWILLSKANIKKNILIRDSKSFLDSLDMYWIGENGEWVYNETADFYVYCTTERKYYKFIKDGENSKWVECDSDDIPFCQNLMLAGKKDANPNMDIKGSITVWKYGQENDSMDGTRFALAKWMDGGYYLFQELKNITNGTVKFSNLSKGTYGLFEFSTKSGYSMKSGDIIIGNNTASDGSFVDGDGVTWYRPLCKVLTISTNNDNYTLNVYNKKGINGEIIITKKDKATGNPMNGVKFALAKSDTQDFNGNFIYKGMATVENGKATFSGLEKGYYRVYEWSTLSGYSMRPDEIEVGDNGGKATEGTFIDSTGITFKSPCCCRFSVLGTNNSNCYSITVKNQKVKRGQITIKKIDVDDPNSNTKMDGTRFALTKLIDSEYVFQRMQTISKGETTFENLEEGQYAIFEWSTLSGYSMDAEDIQIGGTHAISDKYFKDSSGKKFYKPLCYYYTLKSETINTSPSITVMNKRTRGSITVSKKDLSDKNNQKIMDGTKFALTKKVNNKYIYKEMGVISDGKVMFDKLDLGTYAIFEWSTIEGYCTKPQNITVEFNGDKTTATKGSFYDAGNNIFTRPFCKEIEISKEENKRNPQITVYNKKYGKIELIKTDRYNSNIHLPGVGFRLYQYDDGAYKYAYTLKDTDDNGKTSSEQIEEGTYILYEYKNPNPGYNIKYQGQRYDQGRGAYIGNFKVKSGETIKVSDLKYTYKDPNDNNNEKEVKYGQNELFVSIDINKYMEGYDTVVNDITRKKLKGAGFTLYKNGKPVSIRKIESTSYNTEFFTDNDGKLTIERVPVNATYTLYETTFPSWEYNGQTYKIDPEIQPGYNSKTGFVKIATITIKKDGTIDTQYTNPTTQNTQNEGIVLETDTQKSIKERQEDGTVLNRTYRSKWVVNKQKQNNQRKRNKSYILDYKPQIHENLWICLGRYRRNKDARTWR